MLFAGGGLQTGQIIGATDSREKTPWTVACRPAFLATLYNHLGIDAARMRLINLGAIPILRRERQSQIDLSRVME